LDCVSIKGEGGGQGVGGGFFGILTVGKGIWVG